MGSEHRQKITRYGLGLTASILAVYFLLTHSREPIVFFASLFFLVICATDTLQGKIPNLATLSLLLIGLWFNIRPDGLLGGAIALAGMATGLLLLIVPYLLGGMGAGDLKALAALGALLGPAAILQVFIIAGLIGGGMAMIHLAMSDNPLDRLHYWRKSSWRLLNGVKQPMPAQDEATPKIKYSYGPAIAFGFFAFTVWGGLV
jgi:prepilin peptidase CpaA